MQQPSERYVKDGADRMQLKSIWFKTFSHQTFTKLWLLFCEKGSKRIAQGLVKDHLSSRGLAYWIMCDGSLQNDRKSMILHTQGYTYAENQMLSTELNLKFGFDSRVIPHKQQYHVIFFGPKDSNLLVKHIGPHIIPSFSYKLPQT